MPAHIPIPDTITDAELRALLASDPALIPLAERVGPLPERRVSPDFAGLARVVIGQQISVAAGQAIHGRCLATLGALTAEAIAQADDAALRGAGLSASKARTLRAIADAVTGGLDLEALGGMDADAAMTELTRIKGIGPWTAEVFLLFGHGHPDVFPAGDLALQEAARLGFALEVRPSPAALRERAEAWRPRRGLAARLLWAYYRAVRTGRDSTPV